jgi:hypothetical protein
MRHLELRISRWRQPGCAPIERAASGANAVMLCDDVPAAHAPSIIASVNSAIGAKKF